MQISDEARQFVADRQKQGYTHDQIVQELTANGYTEEMINVLIGTAPKEPTETKNKKIIIIAAAAVAILLVLGLAATLLTGKDQPQQATTPQTSTDTTPKQQDVSAVAELTKYTTLRAKAVSFSMSKQWTVDPTIAGTEASRTLFSLYNYDRKLVDAELKAAGVSQNSSSYADVTKREIKSYPYSFDKMHEIQVLTFNEITKVDNLQQLVVRYRANSTAGTVVKDIQYYKVNDTEIVDMILDRKEGERDQRIIATISPDGMTTLRLIIDPTQSRKQVTKENFDGLMELVGSINWEIQ